MRCFRITTGRWLRLLFTAAPLSFCSMLQADELYQYTPSDVYTEALRIKGDISIISSHFNAENGENPLPVKTSLKPRNVWQKSYEIMVKINILREKYGLPRMEEVQVKPLKNLDPGLTHEQVRRILTELDIFMIRVGISSRTSKANSKQRKHRQMSIICSMLFRRNSMRSLARALSLPTYFPKPCVYWMI